MRLNISIQQYDKPLLIVCLFLCAFGTIMLYSASWNESFIKSGGITESLYLKAHLIRVFIGFVCMLIFLILENEYNMNQYLHILIAHYNFFELLHLF